MGFDNTKRSNDIWLLASAKGDDEFKSAVQQLSIHFPIKNIESAEQTIEFAKIVDQHIPVKAIALNKFSSAGLPVKYYIKEGPAEIDGNKIVFTKIPPGAKFPVKVTVVAWQYGRSIAPAIKSAEPVTRTFYIVK